MLKKIKIISILLTMIIATSLVGGVQAASINDNQDDSGAINALYEYVNAMDTQNWDKYISLSPKSEYNNLTSFFAKKEYIEDCIGVHTVKSAEIIDTKELNPTTLPQYRLVENIASVSSVASVKAYIIAADLTVKKETKYHYNGVNMFTVLVAKESNQWKIFAFSVASAETIRDAYSDSDVRTDGNVDISRMLQIAIKRETQAVWENVAGDVIVDNQATEEQLIEEAGGIENYHVAAKDLMVNRTTHTRPGDIRIALYNSSGVRYSIVTVDFYDAIKNTLPNEWGTAWPVKSLKAGAQCVKMVIWSLIVDPWYPNSGFDMKNNNDGHYLPNTENTACTQAINAVSGVGVQNTDGDIFYASYVAGTQGSYGTENGGTCCQWGTKKFAEDGWNYFSMLSYYYSYSSKSGGPIQPFYY